MRTLCLGEALVDLICERHLTSLSGADAFVPHFGGATANVAVAASRHGADVALAGGAGDDAWGTWLRDRLVEEGVAVDWFGLLPGERTGVAFVRVDPTGEPHYLIYGDAIGSSIASLGARAAEAARACDAFFLGSNTLVREPEREVTLAARHAASGLGRPVLFDPNLRLHRWGNEQTAFALCRGIVEGAFLVKCNRDEALAISGTGDVEAAADALLRLGAQNVVVTLGAEGAVLRGAAGLRAEVAAEPAAVRSTTGAGDMLAGVLLARLAAAEYDAAVLPAALTEAVAAATAVVQEWGALP